MIATFEDLKEWQQFQRDFDQHARHCEDCKNFLEESKKALQVALESEE